jgi:phosphonatase-like hydrolase
MSGIKLVVFDIAGTIIEDHGEILRAFRTALMENGIPFLEGELKKWKGASKREVIRYFVTQTDPSADIEPRVETCYRRFRLQLESCYADKIVPIAGAVETFRWLRDHQIRLATTTGFYREISDLVLNQTGWREFFAANISSSDVRQGRPAPYMIFRAMEAAGVENVKEVINVGDTPLDLQSGSNAGVVGVVGVLTGAHGRESLEQQPRAHIIDSIAELPDLITHTF